MKYGGGFVLVSSNVIINIKNNDIIVNIDNSPRIKFKNGVTQSHYVILKCYDICYSKSKKFIVTFDRMNDILEKIKSINMI